MILLAAPSTRPNLWLGTWAALSILLGTAAKAQIPATTDAPQATVNEEVIRSRIQQLEANSTLDPPTRTRAIDLYRQALTGLDAGKAFEANRQEWQNRKAQIPTELARVSAQLEATKSDVTIPDTAEMPQEKLDEQVRQQQIKLDDAKKALNTWRDESKRRDDRSLEIPGLIAGLQQQQQNLDQNAAETANPTNLAAEVRAAQEVSKSVTERNKGLEVEMLRDELSFYVAAVELLPKQVALAQQTVDRAAAEQQLWTRAAEERRRQSAARDAAEKESKASEVPKELKPLADRNLELSRSSQELVLGIEQTNAQLTQVQRQLTNLTDQFKRAQTLIRDQLGVTEDVGTKLREQRSELPDESRLRRENGDRRQLIYKNRSAEFEIGEDLLQLADLDQRVESELRQLRDQQDLSPAGLEALRTEIRQLLEARKKTQEERLANTKIYLANLVNLNVEQDKLIQLVDRYTSFIDERVLWIRSIPPVGLGDWATIQKSLNWFLAPAAWAGVAQTFVQKVREQWLSNLAIALLLALCFSYRHRGLKRLQQLGQEARSRVCRRFSITLAALLWTLVVSLALPAIFLWLGWILNAGRGATKAGLITPLSLAATRTAFVYWPLAFWLHAVRKGGLCDAHFEWSEQLLGLTRKHLTWFVLALVPSIATFYLFQESGRPECEVSLARLAFVAAVTSVGIFVQRMFSPHRGIVHLFLRRNRAGWIYQLRFIWYSLLIAIPTSFAILSLTGYQYTAQRLAECLYLSAIFLSLLYLMEAMSLRWILLNRRKLAIAQARERIASAMAGSSEKKSSELGGGVAAAEQIDLGQINDQTRRLLTSLILAAAAIGLYLIWINVLPALQRLDDIRLWETTVDQPPTMANLATDSTSINPPAPQGRAQYQWITLGHLIRACAVLVLTLIAIRNIPGLLEIAILQHLPLDASIRYAITTVTRYALTIAGLFWGFGTIGFGWSKIQWLAAGISVGLGFGLQEIFANFVSGLILLFERPLRAGDVVTVGDVTGTVVQIKTRATTIQDWDRKELVVPNKEFITGRLLNWTLTDTVNRLVIQVGVAYGSNIAQVRSLLLNIADSHDEILKDPEPNVTFDLFGDSALNFTLRCYLARLDQRLQVTHELHEAIYKRLADTGISIPFPQRDVHLHEHHAPTA